MEVGGSSDDSSSGKGRKLGGGSTGGIADGNPSAAQHATIALSTSDQGSSLANLSSSTVSPAGPEAHSTAASSEMEPPKARFKIGTNSELAQEGSGSLRFTDSQQGGVTGSTPPGNQKEEGERPTR